MAKEALNLSLPPEIHERFMRIYRNNPPITQAKTLEMLLDCYEHGVRVSPQEYSDPNTIVLDTYTDPYWDDNPPRKYCFSGYVVNEPKWTVTRSIDSYVKKSFEELGIYSVSQYSYYLKHKLNVYHDCEKNKYIVQECIQIYRPDPVYTRDGDFLWYTDYLILDKKVFSYVDSYDDVVNQFGKLSSKRELDVIGTYISNEIKQDVLLGNASECKH